MAAFQMCEDREILVKSIDFMDATPKNSWMQHLNQRDHCPLGLESTGMSAVSRPTALECFVNLVRVLSKQKDTSS